MLTDTFVKQVKWKGSKVGDKYSDGGGLYLHVKEAGKYWRVNYRIHGKQKTLALGVYPTITLAGARKGRDAARVSLANGIDPSSAKRNDANTAKEVAATTYESVAREFHKTKATGWSEAHAGKWLRMSELYLFPTLGALPISTIKAQTVVQALRKVEAKGILSTAHDVQQMAGQVFRYALQSGLVEYNPIPDLRGVLKPHTQEHFAAVLEPKKAGELLRAIDSYGGQPTTRAALQISALIFQRPGNVRAMEWSWVDLENSMLTIPSDSLKATKQQKISGKPHLVPLARQAVEILKGLAPLTGAGRFVFPSARTFQRPMSDGTINAALRRLDFGSDDHVAHGFRAMARTMLAEQIAGVPDEIVEAQLAHGKRGPLGSAYDRAEYLPQRRKIMQTWADYLDRLRNGADVVPLRGAA